MGGAQQVSDASSSRSSVRARGAGCWGEEERPFMHITQCVLVPSLARYSCCAHMSTGVVTCRTH